MLGVRARLLHIHIQYHERETERERERARERARQKEREKEERERVNLKPSGYLRVLARTTGTERASQASPTVSPAQ